MKWYKMFFGTFFLAFFSLFGVFQLFSIDVYAVEDIEITLTQRPSSAVSICSSNCSSYKYLIIKTHDFYTNNHNSWYQYFYFDIGWNYDGGGKVVPSGVYGFPPVVSVLELSFPFANQYTNSYLSHVTLSSFYTQTQINTLSSGWSVDIILSENNPFSGGITPSGSLSITENGTYDVTNYAEAVVEVPSEECETCPAGGTNYHDDLVAINNSILICGAICLVLYFFYCIYRMIIKSTGGFR